MNCKSYQIFPINLYEYEIEDKSINQKIIKILEEEEFINNGSNDVHPTTRCYQTHHYLHKKIEYLPVISFIKDCLETHRKNLDFDCDGFDITICWANKYPKYTASNQQNHTHKMSYISGIYYLTNGSPTYFLDPVTNRTYNSLEVNSKENIRQSIFAAEEGKLVLFPSWIEHGTIPHQDVYDRWSIAFNAMPTGKINPKFNKSGNPSCILEVK